MPESPRTSLKALPTELITAIFSSLPDVSSARALALTCSSLFYLFLSANPLILVNILRNQIYPELLTLALAVLDSSKVSPWSKAVVLRLLEHLEARVSRSCTILEALTISELHKHVEFFAIEFASSALAGTSETQASPKELYRIQRALYRFELYCNLFRKREACMEVRFEAEEQRDRFFDAFPYWENEQLACIHDYLFERLSVPFNDIAQHDVYWGELEIPFANDWYDPENCWKEHYLSLGLAYLHQVVVAATYDDRYKLISSNFGIDELSLFAGLKMQDEDDGVTLAEYGSPEEEQKFIIAHLADADDMGPPQAWRWAYNDSTRACLYFGDDQRTLRQSGYVMWDLARLSQQGLFRNPWVSDPDSLVFNPEEEREMQESFMARSKVWRRGGTGWWSPGDESKIQWGQPLCEQPRPGSQPKRASSSPL